MLFQLDITITDNHKWGGLQDICDTKPTQTHNFITARWDTTSKNKLDDLRSSMIFKDNRSHKQKQKGHIIYQSSRHVMSMVKAR